MKKINSLTTKKFFALAVGFVLLIATLFGILLGTHRNAHAETQLNHIERGYTNSNEVTITDGGRYENTYEKFDFKNQFGDVLDYINKGYRYVTIDIDFKMMELDDGYQDIYLYTSFIKSQDYCISHEIFDYYGNKTQGNYNNVGIEFRSFPITEFLDENINMNIIIRFDAHGGGDDDWRYTDFSFRVVLSQEKYRLENRITGKV